MNSQVLQTTRWVNQIVAQLRIFAIFTARFIRRLDFQMRIFNGENNFEFSSLFHSPFTLPATPFKSNT